MTHADLKGSAFSWYTTAMNIEQLHRVDYRIISMMKRCSMPLSRLALFVVYFWFGALKVVGESPASPMVAELQMKTLPFIATDTFMVLFGLLEMFIGLAFLIPKAERIAIGVMVAHMVTTVMPLVLMPDAVWTGFLVPTLEGQYIIKNIALLAVAAGIAAQLVPMQERRS